MQLIPIEKIVSNRDSIRKAREAFLIQKGRIIDPDGLNILKKHINCFHLFPFMMFFHYVILFYRMLVFNLHCQLALLISGITKISGYIKTRRNVKFPLYLKKAGLASRNIVHLQKIILRCVGFCFCILQLHQPFV